MSENLTSGRSDSPFIQSVLPGTVWTGASIRYGVTAAEGDSCREMSSAAIYIATHPVLDSAMASTNKTAIHFFIIFFMLSVYDTLPKFCTPFRKKLFVKAGDSWYKS